MNTETIIHPKLQHIGLTTGRLQPMLDWYKTVLGMRLIYLSENPTGGAHGSSLKAAWLSNDEANHRVAIIEIPGLTDDPERIRHHRLQHIAFEFRTLDELLGTYVRLKASGIVPVLPVDEGSQTALYYADPDGIASSSTSIIRATAGHRSSTSRTHQSSLAVHSASSSILTRWWQRARQAPPRGICTSVPGRANLSRPICTIQPPFCE